MLVRGRARWHFPWRYQGSAQYAPRLLFHRAALTRSLLAQAFLDCVIDLTNRNAVHPDILRET